MKRTLLGRPIHCFNSLFYRFFYGLFISFSFLFCLIPAPSVHSDGILTPQDLSPELIRKIEEAVETFQKPLDKKEYQGIISKTKEEAGMVLSQGKNGEEYLCSDCPESQASVYYFFSFSMPEEVILKAMRDAIKINSKGDEKIALVLRGFVKNDLLATISELYKYLQKIGDDIPVEVDPELFIKFKVMNVPQIIKINGSGEEGEMGIVRGDLASIPYAISRFSEGLKDYGLYGKVYSIKEEDALKVFASKQKEIERRLREKIPEMKKRIVVLNKYDGLFQNAKEERVYYINPKVMLEDDIYDNQGNVIFHAGTIFDPTEYVRLGRYVVIDGNNPKQVEFAIKGDFRKIILISGNIEKLQKTYNRTFYFANDELVERFQIRKVPVVIEGEGKYVKVTEKVVE